MPAFQYKVTIDVADVRRATANTVKDLASANAAMARDTLKTINTQVASYGTLIKVMGRVGEAAKKAALASKAAFQDTDKAIIASGQSVLKSRVRMVETEAKETEKQIKRIGEAAAKSEAVRTAAVFRGISKRAEALKKEADTTSRAFGEATGGGGGGGGRSRGGRTDYTSRFGQVKFDAFGAVRQFGSQYSDASQAARQTRATQQSAVFGAIAAGGGGVKEAFAAHEQVKAFVKENAGIGIKSDDTIAALAAAQEQFSVLQPKNGQTQQQAMSDALDDVKLAHQTYNDPTQVARIGGMLRQGGLDKDTRREVMLSMIGMAQQGSVELGSVTSEGLAPMQQRISTSLSKLGPGASAADRQAAIATSIRKSMAEAEVYAGAGTGVRRAIGNTANLELALNDPNAQDKMLGNIRNKYKENDPRRQQLIDRLFKKDDTRKTGYALRENLTDPMALIGALGEATGGNSLEVQNLFSGGGKKNPQAMQRNWRALVGQMMTVNPETGKANYERVNDLLNPTGADKFGEDDVTRMAAVRGVEDQSQLTANEEATVAAYRDNSSALKSLTDQVANLAAQHPILTQALTALGASIGGSLFARAGTFVAGGGGAAAPALAAGAPGVAPAAGAGLVNPVTAGVAAFVAGLKGGDMLLGWINGGDTDKGRSGRGRDSVFSGDTWGDAYRGFRGALVDEGVTDYAQGTWDQARAKGAKTIWNNRAGLSALQAEGGEGYQEATALMNRKTFMIDEQSMARFAELCAAALGRKPITMDPHDAVHVTSIMSVNRPGNQSTTET